MKILYLSLGIFGLYTIFQLWFTDTYLILPKYNLEKDFGIVASVSEANSIDDIIGRPLYTDKINQYYFKDDGPTINLIRPNIGITFTSEYKGNDLSKRDKVIKRLPKVLNLWFFYVVNINELIKNNFFFKDKFNTKLKFMDKKFYFFRESVNFEINYYDKSILFSFLIFKNNNYKLKEANIKQGYFITLTKVFDLMDTKLQHYITRWNCESSIDIYIDKSVPVDWISTFKIGINKWNNALHAANPKCHLNTISYLDKKWTNFKNGDIKYSSISLAPSSLDRTYAVGHFDFNWKTGEIYRGNVMISGNWIDYWNKQFSFLEKLLSVNKNKVSLGYQKDLISDKDDKIDTIKKKFIKKGIQSVIVHEIGHILGLRHNFKASSLVKHDKLMNYHRIRAIGLIPSIMDYLSMVINVNEIYKCVTIECIWNNVEIMDTIGDYDFQTIQYGYGNETNISYDLGPDEFLSSDALSNTGDISNLPGKYNSEFLALSKYIIDNYNFRRKVDGFDTYWQEQSNLVESHYNYLNYAISLNLKILSKISYNFDGKILNIKKTHIESIKFLRNVLQDVYFLKNKIYFTYPDCDVDHNYYCHGMTPYNLYDIHNKIRTSLNLILSSNDLHKIIDQNFNLTQKTIPLNQYLQIINNYLTPKEFSFLQLN